MLIGPIARALAWFELHDVSLTEHAGAAMIVKRRRRFAPLMIAAGNPLSRRRSAPVEVLGRDAWHARERAVHRALGRIPQPWADERGLWLPRSRGQTLDQLLADNSSASRLRGAAAGHAAAALATLQRVTGSHGDATAENVAVAVEDHAVVDAQWFDFDVRHLPSTDPAMRRADDLRALLFSAPAFAPEDDGEAIAEAVLAGYAADLATLAALDALLRDPRLGRDLFHRAQCRVGDREHRRLLRLCRQAVALHRAGGTRR